jgi:hypothetical protein
MREGSADATGPKRRDPGARSFIHGAWFSHVSEFPQGKVRLRATIWIEGRSLQLWDTEIHPMGESPELHIGVRGMRSTLRSLCSLAEAEGFDRIIISGYRVSSAFPGRDTEWTVACAKLR